jgi:hypothetical protein
MINITRIKWAIDELEPNEEYIQWVDGYAIRVFFSINGKIIAIRISYRADDDSPSRSIQNVFTRCELEHRINDMTGEISRIIDDMMRELRGFDEH